MPIMKDFSGDLDEAWGLDGLERAVEWAGVRVAGRAEAVTVQRKVQIIKAECLKIIKGGMYHARWK
jgi:hypothetical protein